MGMHILLIGEPSEGYRAVGPFKTEEAAENAASDYSEYTWVMKLEAE